MVMHLARLLEQVQQFLSTIRREVELRGNIELKDFFATVIAQNANHRIVNFDETPLRCGDVDSLLNVVKELTIAPFGIAPVSDVFEHMHDL